MKVEQQQLNILLDALCCIANQDETDPIRIAEDAFDALDLSDGRNKFVFLCVECEQWKVRGTIKVLVDAEFAKYGECENCYKTESEPVISSTWHPGHEPQMGSYDH